MATQVKILAFDTSSSACSVALLCENQGKKEIQSLCKIESMQQGMLILPMIQEILSHASLSFDQLDAVAYGCGPGSFTGIRIASSVVMGIGFAASLPIIQISSLAAHAQAMYMERQWEHVLVALDARMGEIYWAKYQIDSQGIMQLVGSEEVGVPATIQMPKQDNWCGVGEGWIKYRETLISLLGYEPPLVTLPKLPLANAILTLASEKMMNRDWLRADQALPVYLR